MGELGWGGRRALHTWQGWIEAWGGVWFWFPAVDPTYLAVAAENEGAKLSGDLKLAVPARQLLPGRCLSVGGAVARATCTDAACRRSWLPTKAERGTQACREQSGLVCMWAPKQPWDRQGCFVPVLDRVIGMERAWTSCCCEDRGTHPLD